MPASLSPRERFLACLDGREVDVVPFQEMFFSHSGVAEHYLPGQNCQEDCSEFILRLGWCSRMVGGLWWTPGRRVETASDGKEHYAGGTRPSMDEVRNLEEPDLAPKVAEVDEALPTARKRDLASHVWVMSGFHSASSSMGLENLSYTLCDEPEVLHAFIDRVERLNLRFLESIRDREIDTVFIDGDCAYKNGLMVRPQTFRELWFEPTRRLVAFCREQGWRVGYHTDGKIDEVYPMLIELGIHAAHGVESAANDLADIKKRFGRDLTLIGNYDIVDLAHKTPEQIVADVHEMLEIGRVGGRYAAGCNTLPSENIPVENYVAFRDAIVNFGKGYR